MPHHTEARQERYIGKCKACVRKEMDGHNHSVTSSLRSRLGKFNKGFKKNGYCKLHNV